MELSEAFVRVVGRHIVLIALLVGCGLLGAGLLHGGDPAEYRGTVRLVLGTGDPSNQAQSAVIGDTARALATGPVLVADALRKVGASRDALDTARHHIDAQILGSSGVVSLSVTDTNAAVAVALANAIGAGVIRAHGEMVDGRYEETLAGVQTNIAQTERSIASLDAHIKAVGPLFEVIQLPLVSLSERPWAAPNLLLRQRVDLAQGLMSLQTERATVEAGRALHAQGVIVDTAAGPADRVPGQLVPYLALGGLLGLMIGLGLAATLETLRPTLVGRDAIARTLGAPVLAEIRGAVTFEGDVAEAAMHIELAAAAADVRRVALLAPSSQLDLRPLADLLGHSVKGLTLHVLSRGGAVLTPQARVSTPKRAAGDQGADWLPAADGATGVVLVTPKIVRLAELTRIVDFFTISGWPLMGLIVVRSRRGRIHLAKGKDVSAGPGTSAALDTATNLQKSRASMACAQRPEQNKAGDQK